MEAIRKMIKCVWLFCSYLFLPQWGKQKVVYN